MTAEHAHGIDAGGEVEAVLESVLAAHSHPGEVLHVFGEAWMICGCGERFDLEIVDNAIPEVNAQWYAHFAAALAEAGITDVFTTRQTAADAVLAEARRLCCGENPAAHHAATDKHSELMAFAGRLAGAVRGR